MNVKLTVWGYMSAEQVCLHVFLEGWDVLFSLGGELIPPNSTELFYGLIGAVL